MSHVENPQHRRTQLDAQPTNPINRVMGFLASRRAVPLRILLLLLWLAALAFGGMAQGKIGTVSENDQAVFLPKTAESTLAKEEATKFNASSTIPALVVASTSGNEKLTDSQLAWLKNLSQNMVTAEIPGDIALSELLTSPMIPVVPNEDKTAALLPMSLDAAKLAELSPDGEKRINSATAALRATINDAAPQEQGLTVRVSGPVGLAADLGSAFTGIDLTLLLVALGLVFVILVAVYRSLLLPFAVLGTAMAALCAAVLVVYELAKNDILSLNGQTQGILAILVIGATTDYCLLLIARYREEMMVKATPIDALATALKGSWEPIVASGGTVICGLLTLMLSDLSSTASLGPIAAIGILFAIFAALTLLPGILMLPGKRASILFWPAKLPHYDSEAEAIEKSHGAWNTVANFVARHDRPVWISTLAALAVSAAFFFTFPADGTSTTDQFTSSPEAVVGFEVLQEKFDAGSSQPTTVVVREDKADSLKERIEALDGVASVEFATDAGASGAPAGVGGRPEAAGSTPGANDAGEAPARESAAARPQGTGQAPTSAGRPTSAANAEPTIVDGKALLNVTTTMPSEDKAAGKVVTAIRSVAHDADAGALVGGPAAETLDTQTTANNDFNKIFPVVLVVIAVLLMILLRAIVAPLIVLAVNVVSFAAAMGLSGILFFQILNHPGADASIPIYAFVFLVALGVDYTIFLLSRAREESLKHGTREGTKRAATVTGGVITSAGVVLAATFAALVVVPLLFMFQLAVIVALGILIDTFIVRTLTIVGITHDIGRPIWLPWTARKVPADTK